MTDTNFELKNGADAKRVSASIKHASLFTGIGGFDLAAQWTGWENVFQVEKDEWCRKVLAKNFPKAKRYADIKEFDGKPYRGTVDIISGGFPCQPFSVAGKQKGKGDDRYLWEEMLRVVGEVKPPVVVGENVTGIIGMALDTVLSDLEAQGYTTETFVIPACGKNAWHRRERVWIVAYANGIGWHNEQEENGQLISNRNGNYTTKKQSGREQQCRVSESSEILSDTSSKRCNNGGDIWEERYFQKDKGLATKNKSERKGRKRGSGKISSVLSNTASSGTGLEEYRSGGQEWENTNASESEILRQENGALSSEGDNSNSGNGRGWWEVEPELGRVANGIPDRLDRLRGLGNAIVPQVAYEIFSAVDFCIKSGAFFNSKFVLEKTA